VVSSEVAYDCDARARRYRSDEEAPAPQTSERRTAEGDCGMSFLHCTRYVGSSGQLVGSCG
jgi:hypothetical protein